MIVQNYIKKLSDVAWSQKRVRIPETDRFKEFDTVIEKIFNYIKYFNAEIKELDTQVLGVDLDKIKIPNEFKDFILPRTVKFIADDSRCIDFLIRDSYISKDIKDANDFKSLCSRFRGFYKKDLSQNVSNLDTLKNNVSLSDVQSRASVKIGDNYKVHYADKPFVPINLEVFGDFFEQRYFNCDEADMVKDYLLEMEL